MPKLFALFFAVTVLPLAVSFLFDRWDSTRAVKARYQVYMRQRAITRWIHARLPHRVLEAVARKLARYPRAAVVGGLIITAHAWLHFANPYADVSFFTSPYSTTVADDGTIDYHKNYDVTVLSDPVSDLAGYYRSGFLIAQNTLVGGDRLEDANAQGVIDQIHEVRFDPSKPYLISGDQFSVLYPRNLGVFYNQLLDPNTAHSTLDWENRQRIYLQSVLLAIDGLTAGDIPKTTLVPIAPRTITATTVHPGDISSDAVFGTLYALDKLRTAASSDDGRFSIATTASAQKILTEKRPALQKMVNGYLNAVTDPKTKMVRRDIHLASARDGVSRKSSFYDNIILWKTRQLASDLGIVKTNPVALNELQTSIKSRYWHENGYYQNDVADTSFSSDWLIGYPTGFFDLKNKTDKRRSEQTVDYVEANGLAQPLPIKYQNGQPDKSPWVIRTFIPEYGGEAIWSYWGAEYITLLANLAASPDDPHAIRAKQYIETYRQAIVRDGGFAETFNSDGQLLRSGLYKSIRVTGWVVQFEHAVDRYESLRAL